METRFFTCDTCGSPSNARHLNRPYVPPDKELAPTWIELRDGNTSRHFCRPVCFQKYVLKEWST